MLLCAAALMSGCGKTITITDSDRKQPPAAPATTSAAASSAPAAGNGQLEVVGSVYLAGVDPKQVGAIRRAGGTVQLTVGGWPIYRCSGDSKPGDLNGQGVGARGSRPARTARRSSPPSNGAGRPRCFPSAKRKTRFPVRRNRVFLFPGCLIWSSASGR
ncbi:hypothetical protein [Actinoplanes sp. NPDC020271]|uniref:hypothetical protein n=1 Tax=Actinoplanes sp. NPDC020271 TaxID=3363896 RepID=UPI0037874160